MLGYDFSDFDKTVYWIGKIGDREIKPCKVVSKVGYGNSKVTIIQEGRSESSAEEVLIFDLYLSEREACNALFEKIFSYVDTVGFCLEDTNVVSAFEYYELKSTIEEQQKEINKLHSLLANYTGIRC